MQLPAGRHFLPVFLLELLEMGLPGRFANRFTLRVELVLVLLVPGVSSLAIAALTVRLPATALDLRLQPRRVALGVARWLLHL
jgi:hypothetical protein